MWNKKRSLALSKLSTLIFMGLLVGVLVTAPWLVDWLKTLTPNAMAPKWCFLATMYTGGLVAALLLYDLYRLLHNIGEGLIFIDDNVKRLRRISWYCIAGGVISAVSFVYYLPWLFVAAAAAFVGLIVRIVKNVIAEANTLKRENDYTI